MFAALTAMMVVWGGSAAATSSSIPAKSPQLSGAWEFGDEAIGSNITECPQAGLTIRACGGRIVTPSSG